jgi:hypothetical protein
MRDGVKSMVTRGSVFFFAESMAPMLVSGPRNAGGTSAVRNAASNSQPRTSASGESAGTISSERSATGGGPASGASGCALGVIAISSGAGSAFACGLTPASGSVSLGGAPPRHATSSEAPASTTGSVALRTPAFT